MQCCHKNEPNKNSTSQGQHQCGSGIKHMLLMIVCCLAPLGGALLLRQFGYEGVASYLVLLLCPIMHFFMMRDMGHKKQETVNEKN